MPTTRYFAATDGTRTYFRASSSRAYRSMSNDPTYPRQWSFHMYSSAPYPVHEITGKEYRALIRAKAVRTSGTAPSDSWVYNRDLAEVFPEGLSSAVEG